jgi:hypothetical protein
LFAFLAATSLVGVTLLFVTRSAPVGMRDPDALATAVRSPPARVAAAGDIACDPDGTGFNGGKGTETTCHMNATADLLEAGDYDAVLTLGDNQYNSGTASEFEDSYDPSWGRVKGITYPSVGNHEYGTPGASGYFDYFGEAAGDPDEGYYSFDVGSWHVIALNSNCAKVEGGCRAGSPQERWLRADLAAHPAACTAAFWHHPRFSSGHEGNSNFVRAFWKDLYRGGAELVLSGHSHDYERFAPQDQRGRLKRQLGVRQFVVGTGGSFFTGFHEPVANSKVRNNNTFGVLELRLSARSYTWRFVPEAGRSFTDSGSTACHGRPRGR